MVSWRRPIHFLGHDRSNETWSRVDEYLNLSTRLLDKIYVSRMSDEVTSLWSLTAINIKSYTHSNYKFSNETYGDQPNAKETIKTPQNSHRWPVDSTQKGHWCCDAKCFLMSCRHPGQTVCGVRYNGSTSSSIAFGKHLISHGNVLRDPENRPAALPPRRITVLFLWPGTSFIEKHYLASGLGFTLYNLLGYIGLRYSP